MSYSSPHIPPKVRTLAKAGRKCPHNRSRYLLNLVIEEARKQGILDQLTTEQLLETALEYERQTKK